MYGNCFTFNGNEANLKKSYLIGPDFGLQLVLYVKVYESLLNITDVSDEIGAVIRVGNSSFSRFVSNGATVTVAFLFRQALALISKWNVNLYQCCPSLIVTVKLTRTHHRGPPNQRFIILYLKQDLSTRSSCAFRFAYKKSILRHTTAHPYICFRFTTWVSAKKIWIIFLRSWRIIF